MEKLFSKVDEKMLSDSLLLAVKEWCDAYKGGASDVEVLVSPTGFYSLVKVYGDNVCSHYLRFRKHSKEVLSRRTWFSLPKLLREQDSALLAKTVIHYHRNLILSSTRMCLQEASFSTTE